MGMLIIAHRHVREIGCQPMVSDHGDERRTVSETIVGTASLREYSREHYLNFR